MLGGIVVIGGLTMATILTLIILPIFYLFFCKKDEDDKKDRKVHTKRPLFGKKKPAV